MICIAKKRVVGVDGIDVCICSALLTVGMQANFTLRLKVLTVLHASLCDSILYHRRPFGNRRLNVYKGYTVPYPRYCRRYIDQQILYVALAVH